MREPYCEIISIFRICMVFSFYPNPIFKFCIMNIHVIRYHGMHFCLGCRSYHFQFYVESWSMWESWSGCLTTIQRERTEPALTRERKRRCLQNFTSGSCPVCVGDNLQTETCCADPGNYGILLKLIQLVEQQRLDGSNTRFYVIQSTLSLYEIGHVDEYPTMH